MGLCVADMECDLFYADIHGYGHNIHNFAVDNVEGGVGMNNNNLYYSQHTTCH